MRAVAVEKPGSTNGFAAIFRAEYPLLVALASAAFFLWLGDVTLGGTSNPIVLAAIFGWLFLAVLWSAISVV